MSSGSNFDVVVRLSTIGTSDLAAGMNKAKTSTQEVATELDKADITAKRLSTTVRGVTEDGAKYSVTMKQMADAHRTYTSTADALTSSLLTMAGAIISLQALKGLVTDIYGAVKAHEDETLTIAATMAATNGWSNSMVIATGALEKLKETGALVGGTTAQMVETFTLLKRTFGGTSDDAVLLTEKLSLLARQYGTTSDLLATRLAGAAITGRMVTRGVAGIALTSTGIDPQELMTMKAAGEAMDYLNAKIAEDPELVAQLKNNWSYLGAELSKVTETSMETIGQGLTPLKTAVKDFTAALDSAEAQAAFDTIGRQLGTLNGQLISLLPNAEAGTSFFASFSTNILKGFNVFLADLIFISKELSAAVSGIFDVILNPDKYFAAGGKDRLKAQLDGIVKLYQENQAKITAIYAAGPGALTPGSAGFIGPPAPEKPTNPAPGRLNAVALDKIAEDNFKAANAVADAWDKAYLETLTGLDKQVAAVDMATQKEIDDFLKPGVTWAQVVDFTVAKTAEGEAKKTALIAAEEEKRQKKLAVDAAWYTGEMSKLTDQLNAISDDYYASQSAALQKKTDAERRGIEERKAHGDLDPNQYANAIAALTTLDMAEQAHLARERDSVVGFRKNMEAASAVLVMTTNSVAGGLQTGWNTVMAGLKTTTESVRDYVVGAWGDMATAFDSSFVAVLSGNLNSLKDVFKTFISSLQKSFATFITDSILPKIKDALGVANQAISSTTGQPLPEGTSYSQVAGGQPTTTAGRLAPSGAALYAGAGLMALGAVSAASGSNTLMGSGVAQAGISIGASIAAAVPPLFWVGLIVVAVGVIASALTPATADIKKAFSGDAMASAIVKGMAFGVAGTPTGDATKAAVDLENSTIAFFADIFKKADPNFSRDILKTFKEQMIDYLKTINPTVSAGAQADFNADITKIFTDMIPKALMHLYFGQTTSFADPGGIGGFQKQWAASGTWESAVDPNSPLVKFLTNLGLTIGDVNAIASQIDLLTPAEFQTYFSGIVSAFIDFKNHIKNLSQSWAEIQVAISAAEHPDVVAQFAVAGAAIVQTAKDLSLYSGQTWADKAKELNTTADQYYQAAFTALKALKDMMDAMAVQAQAIQNAISDYGKDPAWLQADRIARMSPPKPGPGIAGGTGGLYYHELAATSDPAAIQKIWDAFIKDATDSLNYLIAIVQAVNSALASVDAGAQAFHATARDYMKSDMWLYVDRLKQIAPNSSTSPWRQTLAGATTVADVQKTWDGFMADANANLTYLIGIIQQVNTALASVDATTKAFHKTFFDYNKSPEWLQADRIARTSAGGQWAGELGSAATVADVQKAWDAFMVDANAALTYLLNIVTAVVAAMANVAASTKAFHLAASEYMKDADWLQQDRVTRMVGDTWKPGLAGSTWTNALNGATTVEGIQSVWDSFMADATASLNYLISIVNQADAGMKTANDLAAKFGSIMADAERVTTVYTIWEDVGALQGQYADAMKLSGQDQLTALDAINASAATLYASLMQIIQGINSAETSVHKSIQQQIWENNYSQAGTDPNRLGMINSQISGLMGGIGSQMTAGDVSSTASEAQSMISRYLGMFSANDPNRAAAVAQANRLLAELDKATHDRLEVLKAQAKKDADDAKKLLDLTAGAFHDASVTATESIRLLGLAVDVFRGNVDTKLRASLETAVQGINKLNNSVDAFRLQVDTVLQGSLTWAISSITDLGNAVDTFRLEVDTKLHGFADAAILGIDALGISVARFQGLVDGNLTTTANHIVTDLNLVGGAFLTALGDFTKALEGPPALPGGPGGGGPGGPNDPNGPLIPAVNTGATALGFFTTAVNAATNALGGATS